MAWDILPKANLQYFLTKLKNKFLMLTNYNKLGAKNILPYPYAYGSGTVHGLAVTVNDDGSVTANGQPTQNVAFTLVSNIITEYDLQVGDKLIFSESNVENQNASAALVYVSPSGAIDLVQGDYELTVTSDMVTRGVAFILWFNTGVDLTTPATFKPMLRLDTDPDPTWVTPAFTNRKLTELVVYLSRHKSTVTANPSTTTATLTSVNIDGTSYAVQASSDPNKVDKTGDTMTGDLKIVKSNTGTSKVWSGLDLGNSYAEGSTGNTQGAIYLYSNTANFNRIVANNLQNSHDINLPDKDGTVVLNSDLATVATSGSYNDLSNKPTIPAAQVNSDWNSSSGVSQILNKPTIPDAVYMGVIGSGSTILGKLTSNSTPAGNTLWQTQQADDSPTKGTVSSILMCKHTGNGTYSYIYHFNQNGQIRYASTGNPVPSSLTWTQIDAKNANYATSAGSATDSTKEPKLAWTYKSSSGSWNYWKDSGNRYHLHYSSGNASVNYNSQLGGLYYVSSVYTINLPVTLTSAYSLNVSCSCSNGLVGATIQSYTSSQVKLYLWASQSGSKTIQIFMDIVST